MTSGLALSILSVALLLAPAALSAEEDPRQAVRMPEMMQTHLRANMRDHLRSMSAMQSALASGQYGVAAEIAEQRLGMTSLEAHDARHMVGFMPEGMQAVGTAMHRAASRFAVIAQDASVSGDLSHALGALSEITQQCVACHAGYRLVAAP